MGATTPNTRTCHLLTHRDGLLVLSFIPLSSARREAPLGVLPQEFCQTGSATSHPRPPGSPQSGSLFPGKGIFGPEKSGSGKPNRMSFPQRRTLMKSKSDAVGWSWHYGADCALGNPDELIE